MASVRLDPATEGKLKRLATRRGQTKSEVIRDAIARLAQEEEQRISAYHRLQPFAGIFDSSGRQLATNTGRRFRELLEERRHAHRPG